MAEEQIERICPYCLAPLVGQVGICPICKTPHHVDCWNENGECSTLGCPANTLTNVRYIKPGTAPGLSSTWTAVYPPPPLPPPAPRSSISRGLLALGAIFATVIALGCLLALAFTTGRQVGLLGNGPTVTAPSEVSSEAIATNTATTAANPTLTLPPQSVVLDPGPSPIPEPSPTQPLPPSPTPQCSLGVASEFQGIWDRAMQGCPITPPATVWAAWQPFERGYMLWRRDTDMITVFTNQGRWMEFPNQWVEGVSVPSRGAPPAGRVAPVRGFGYLWGSNNSVADSLGWAIEEEKGFCADVQSFEKGFVFRSNDSVSCSEHGWNWAWDPGFQPLLFSIYYDGTWERR